MDRESILSIKAGNSDTFNAFNLNKNFSLIIGTIPEVVRTETDPEYEQFLADVWVGIVLTLMVLSCVCCMCSCLLYHKFQQWKRSGKQQSRQLFQCERNYTINLFIKQYKFNINRFTTILICITSHK